MAGGRLWTPDEDRYLRDNYQLIGRRACAVHLARSEDGVKDRVRKLSIQVNAPWSTQEDSVLSEMYPKIGRAGCVKLLTGRTTASVGARAGFLVVTNDRRHTPTEDEEKVIRAEYRQRGGRKKCAQLLPHLTLSTISHIAEKLNVLQRNRKRWTVSENRLLKLHYADKGKNWCARKLAGRTANAIVFQARQLGLVADSSGRYFREWQGRAAASKRGRPKPGFSELVKRMWAEGRIPRPVSTPERCEKQAAKMRAWHARFGNPNKGKKLSLETKRKMSMASRRMWSNPEFRARVLTPERRERRGRLSSEYWARSGRANENAYSRCGGGRRIDLGDTFFRSGWEANYARVLNYWLENKIIHRWEFEPDRFKFPVKDRPRSYTPDFKLWERANGDFYYVEIKGWMDPMSKVKRRYMDKFYPDVQVRLVGQLEYKTLQAEFAPLLENWEFYSSRYIAKRKRTPKSIQ